MLAWLRRALIASQYLPAHPAEPTAAETLAVQHACSVGTSTANVEFSPSAE